MLPGTVVHSTKLRCTESMRGRSSSVSGRVRLGVILVTSAICATGVVARVRWSAMRRSGSNALSQLREERKKIDEVEKTISPESGPNLGEGIGDFPPWYDTQPSHG